MIPAVSMQRKVSVFIGFYGLCLIVQLIGGYVTQLSVHDWYQGLAKSELTPPGAVFGITWTILYFLMAVAATCIYLIRNTLRSSSMVWWFIQLILGLIWSFVFFGHREPGLALIVITINWTAVIDTIRKFEKHDSKAALMMCPLLAWLTFAAYLNAVIVYKM